MPSGTDMTGPQARSGIHLKDTVCNISGRNRRRLRGRQVRILHNTRCCISGAAFRRKPLGEMPGKAEASAMRLESEYSLLNGSGDYGNMIKRRKENAREKEILTARVYRICRDVRDRARIQRDAHHGGLPAGRVLRGVGSHLPAVSDRRIYLTSEQSKGKQEKPGPDRHVGSIYFRDLITEDPVRDGKLLPHDGNRSRSDPVRAVRRQHPGGSSCWSSRRCCWPTGD